MRFLRYYRNTFELSLLLIIIFNIALTSIIPIRVFDQCMNLLLSISIFEYLRNNKLKIKKKTNFFDILLSLFIIFTTLFRTYWTFVYDDKFIFFVLTLLLISFLILNYSFKNILLNVRAIFMASLFPIYQLLFIPLSIILTPISTAVTWFILNIFGFKAYTIGQEVYVGNGAVDITFGCSGSEQIIFTVYAMLVLNFLIPFRKTNIFYMQILLSCLITFFVNILRLCILAVFVHTYQSNDFSIFDFFHGPKGSLIFTFLSTLLSCEVYKKLYLMDEII